MRVLHFALNLSQLLHNPMELGHFLFCTNILNVKVANFLATIVSANSIVRNSIYWSHDITINLIHIHIYRVPPAREKWCILIERSKYHTRRYFSIEFVLPFATDARFFAVCGRLAFTVCGFHIHTLPATSRHNQEKVIAHAWRVFVFFACVYCAYASCMGGCVGHLLAEHDQGEYFAVYVHIALTLQSLIDHTHTHIIEK